VFALAGHASLLSVQSPDAAAAAGSLWEGEGESGRLSILSSANDGAGGGNGSKGAMRQWVPDAQDAAVAGLEQRARTERQAAAAAATAAPEAEADGVMSDYVVPPAPRGGGEMSRTASSGEVRTLTRSVIGRWLGTWGDCAAKVILFQPTLEVPRQWQTVARMHHPAAECFIALECVPSLSLPTRFVTATNAPCAPRRRTNDPPAAGPTRTSTPPRAFHTPAPARSAPALPRARLPHRRRGPCMVPEARLSVRTNGSACESTDRAAGGRQVAAVTADGRVHVHEGAPTLTHLTQFLGEVRAPRPPPAPPARV